MPKLLFANPNSRAMVARPEDIPPDVRPFYDVIGDRLLWTLGRGDVAVVPGPVNKDFLAYLAGTLGLLPEEFTVLSLRDYGGTGWYPGDRPELAAELRSVVERSGLGPDRWTVGCYLHDRDIAGWQRALGLDPGPAEVFAQNMVELVNTKSVFRAMAVAAGVPVPEGLVVDPGPELVDAVADLLPRTGSVIVKQDQNSGGDGNVLVTTDPDVVGLGAYRVLRLDAPGREAVRAALDGIGLAGAPALPRYTCAARIVVEVYHPHARTLSSEVYVPAYTAPVLLNYGHMRMEPVWKGYVFPPQDLPGPLHAALCADSQQIALLAQRLGYQGLMNIDAVVDPAGRMLFTEFNGRAGGATNIDVMARRLVGEDYLRSHVVMSHNALPARSLAVLLDHLAEQDLLFAPERRSGVVVATDSSATTGTVEIVSFGTDRRQAEELETRVEDYLRGAAAA
ncbi:preATP grasp domain-containing protein [Streptomyces sp. NPDC004031]